MAVVKADNSFIPPQTLLVLAVAAKMKRMCALTDIPHAVTSPELLDQLNYNLCEIRNESSNYERSEVTMGKKREPVRGYKLTTFGLMLDQGGLIEQICMSSIKTHDLEA